MNSLITSLHHVTAIASDPQHNIDFYTRLLGLRLVKRTVNFDDPSAYHLYYGDYHGTPGSILTFFYWPGASSQGKIGNGQPTALVFSAPSSSLTFWQDRLNKHGVEAERVLRFGEETLQFSDPDHIPVEIVATADDPRHGSDIAGIPAEFSLRGFHSVELCVKQPEHTAELLTSIMGFRHIRTEGARQRFAIGNASPGCYADIVASDVERGLSGAGTIHHIAWSVPDAKVQASLRQRLLQQGYLVSDVRDRTYFRSIYYRDRNGILFEIATATPGFTVDEPLSSLGRELQLPAQFSELRNQIVQALPSLNIPE
jgi:glyoxalase family protein